MSFVFILLAFVVVLGPLVFVHELGHFAAAKWFKVRVEVFSIGFGPRIIGFQKGETDYRIAPIPLGGYVRMSGEYSEEGDPDDPARFNNKPRWQRLVILAAGPAVNVVCALFIWWGLFMVGFYQPIAADGPPTVAQVVAGSPAASAGIVPGDKIVAVDGVEVDSGSKLIETVLFRPGRTVPYSILRGDATLSLDVAIGIDELHSVGRDGVVISSGVAITAVSDEGPADLAGLEPGDVVLTVGETTPLDLQQFIDVVQASPLAPLPMKVRRGDAVVETTVTPADAGDGRGVISVSLGPPVELVRLGPVAALGAATEYLGSQSLLLFETVKRLVTGYLGVQALSGPLEIARVSKQQIEMGSVQLLNWMALLSLQLGILNLLPIPVLDGGQMLLIGVEAARRRDLSPKLKERVLLTGFVMVVVLMFTVVGLDIYKNVRRASMEVPTQGVEVTVPDEPPAVDVPAALPDGSESAPAEETPTSE